MKLLLRLLFVAGIFCTPALAFAQVGTAPLPTCGISVTPSCVEAGSRALLQWQSSNATGGTISDDQDGTVYNITPQSSLYVTPSQTTLYTATMSGQGGQNFCSVRLTVVGFGTGLCNGAAASASGSSGGATNGSTSGGSPPTLGTSPTLGNTPTLGTTPTLNTGGSSNLFPTGQTTAPAQTTPTNTSLSGGLVPCGNGTQTGPQAGDLTPYVTSSTSCNICSISQLVQKIINFLLGAAILIAAIMFAYAGFKYFSAGGDTGKIEGAHRVFKNVGIGFALALCSWLLVQTLLGTLVGANFFQNIGGSWNTLNCTGLNRLQGVSISSWLTSSLPSLQTPALTGSSANPNNTFSTDQNLTAYGPGVSCPSGMYYMPDAGECSSADGDQIQEPIPNGQQCPGGFTYSTVDGTGSCYNPTTDEIADPAGGGGGGTVANPQMAAQLAAACQQYGIDCSVASAIAGNESSGGNNCATSDTGAAGCMQVLATTACGLNPGISDSCGACLTPPANSTSPACAPVIQAINSNPQTGVNLGVQFINQIENGLQNNPNLQASITQYGICQETAAAYYAGPGAVSKYNGVIANIPTPNYAGAISPAQYASNACGS